MYIRRQASLKELAQAALPGDSIFLGIIIPLRSILFPQSAPSRPEKRSLRTRRLNDGLSYVGSNHSGSVGNSSRPEKQVLFRLETLPVQGFSKRSPSGLRRKNTGIEDDIDQAGNSPVSPKSLHRDTVQNKGETTLRHMSLYIYIYIFGMTCIPSGFIKHGQTGNPRSKWRFNGNINYNINI